jgi:hypothetical protein
VLSASCERAFSPLSPPSFSLSLPSVPSLSASSRQHLVAHPVGFASPIRSSSLDESVQCSINSSLVQCRFTILTPHNVVEPQLMKRIIAGYVDETRSAGSTRSVKEREEVRSLMNYG